MRLVAYWTAQQDPAKDPPAHVYWSDGSHASMQSFARIRPETQSQPHFLYGDVLEAVEFSYEVED